MAFQLSPGVNVSEVDLTTVVPSVLTTAGAFAGSFQWGPANKITLVDSEITLAKTFGEPDSNTAISFFTAANFLSYGNNLSLVRAVGPSSNNAVDGPDPIRILNEEDYQYNHLSPTTDAYGAVCARYPGALGNSIEVSICANTSLFSTWSYSSYFPSAPGTSDYVAAVGGADDEMHIVIIDAGGAFTGTAGTVLETFGFVSKASDAVNQNDGSSNHYKQVVFNKSKYVYAGNPMGYQTALATWNKPAIGNTFASLPEIFTTRLTNGSDEPANQASLEQAYAQFSNKETTDVSLILTGNASVAVQQYVIDNVANSRKDCIAFISPPSSAVVNQSGSETSNITTWLGSLARSSSYVVSDSGWKYQFDKYNNVYRWVPLNGDVAGLCVYTDSVRDPWFSPAGFNRGSVKNAIKLAWNPNKTQRDVLYNGGVNPVVTFPGQGTVLFGDKTLQSKPSAFDRINVRRLFIILEKTIARAARYSLFELNDEFTRAQFISLVTPYLRDIQGRRGITDFKVVCDNTNNTQQVIDSNQFVGDIYIKPARSINFIQLNFVAVGTGVDFNTIVGAV